MKERAAKCYFKSESIYTTISGKEIELSHEMYDEFIEDIFLDTLKNNDFSKNRSYAIYADGGGHLAWQKNTNGM
jgi:hypothetical protein